MPQEDQVAAICKMHFKNLGDIWISVFFRYALRQTKISTDALITSHPCRVQSKEVIKFCNKVSNIQITILSESATDRKLVSPATELMQ